MAVDHLLTRPATIRHRTKAAPDAYGDRAPSTSSTTDTTVYIEQTQAVEVLVGQETYRSEWLLWLPASDTVDATDELVSLGQMFEVIGEPWAVWNPRRGVVSHYHARLREVTG